MWCVARAKGADHLRRGLKFVFKLSDDEENHQDTGMYLNTPAGSVGCHMMKTTFRSPSHTSKWVRWDACSFLLLINPWEISAEPSNLKKQVLAYNCPHNGKQVISSNPRVLPFLRPLP